MARSVVSKWIVQHAADTINRHTVGHDGRVPYQRLMNRLPKGIDIEFGEQVWAKTPEYLNKRKRSLQEKSVLGTWLGIWPPTGQNLVAVNFGTVVRVRTAMRRLEAERWLSIAIDF